MTLVDYINSQKPTLIDFGADWCGPCHALAPVVKQVKRHLGGKLNVLTVDVDANPQVAEYFSILGVPTLILFQSGKILWRTSGVLPEAELLRVVTQFV